MAAERQRGPCVPMSTPSPNTHLRHLGENSCKTTEQKIQHKKEKEKKKYNTALFLLSTWRPFHSNKNG